MVKEILTTFCDETSAQGFKQTFLGTKLFDRLFWGLCTLAAWCAMLYYGVLMIQAYFEYPTDTSITLQYENSNGFPAVTICNVNPMPFSTVKKLATINDTLLDELRNMTAVLNKTEEAVSWEDTKSNTKSSALDANTAERLKRMVEANMFILGNEVMSKYGHQIENMLLECTYQGFQCYPENFTQWQHGQYGNCYTMYLKQDDYPTSLTGPQFGLQLQLYVQTKEYLPRAVSQSGFRVVVHHPTEVAFPEENGFTISPGSYASVALKQLTISRLPLPYDGTDCIAQDEARAKESNVYKNMAALLTDAGHEIEEMDYTFGACVKSCYEKLAVQQCGCVDAASISNTLAAMDNDLKDKKPCDLGVMHTLQDRSCLVKEVQPNASAQCGQKCIQPCEQVQYITRVSNSMWPNNDYIKLAVQKFGTRINDITNTLKNVVPSLLLTNSTLGGIVETLGLQTPLCLKRRKRFLDIVQNLVNNTVNLVNNTVSNVTGTVGNVVNNTVNLVNNTVSNVTGTVGNVVNNTVNLLNNTVSNVTGTVGNVVNNTVNLVNNTVSNVTGTVGNVVNNTVNKVTNSVTSAGILPVSGSASLIASLASSVMTSVVNCAPSGKRRRRALGDMMATYQANLTAGVSGGQMTANMTAGVSGGQMTANMTAGVSDGQMTANMTAGVSGGQMTANMTAGVSGGQMTANMTAGVSGGQMTANMTAGVSGGQMTANMTAGVSGGQMTTNMTATNVVSNTYTPTNITGTVANNTASITSSSSATTDTSSSSSGSSGLPDDVIRALGDFYIQNLLRSELVGIEIFYEELNVEAIEESERWKLFDLMSNTGGMFGLFIGITFLTAVEVVILIKDLICYPFTKKKQTENECARPKSATPSHFSLAVETPSDKMLLAKRNSQNSTSHFDARKISVQSYTGIAPPKITE